MLYLTDLFNSRFNCVQTLSLWNLCLEKDTRFFQPVPDLCIPVGDSGLSSPAGLSLLCIWMLALLCMGVAEAGLHAHSNPSLFILSMWLIPGVGGGQAPELVTTGRFFLLVCLFLLHGSASFLLPEENKFLPGLECLFRTMTAFFPFYLWRVPERGNCLDVQSISFTEEKCFFL